MSGKIGAMFGNQEPEKVVEEEAEIRIVAADEPATPTRSAPTAQHDEQMKTILGAGCIVEGKLVCSGPTRIDGSVSGEIVADDLMIIDKGATVIADLDVQEISVKGHVKGNIIAGKRISLASSAHIEGDIRTPSLTIEEGALVQGKVEVEPTMGDSPDAIKIAETPVPRLEESETAEVALASGEPMERAPSQIFGDRVETSQSDVYIARP